MTDIAPYISEPWIESFSWNLLTQMYPDGVPVPVPVEEIAEHHYKLALEYEELEKEISGYCDLERETIWINSLEMSHVERMRFTIAHELGHYSLHKYFMQKGKVLYNKSLNYYRNNHFRLELQANLFAGYCLMPRPLALKKWAELGGPETPYSLEAEAKRNEGMYFLDPNIDDRSFLFTRDMAEAFEVSYTCASIQLKKLGFFY